MELAARLIEVDVPARPEGAVLVLHGGASRRDRMRVSPTQLSVLRMVPIARRVARVGQGRLAVFRLLNSARGWDTSHTPVDDARWALGEIARRLGGAPPVCLIGHSLGGRAALMACGRPDVAGAVALAPWVYPDDRPQGLSDQRVLVVHGSRDRIADPQRSAAVVRAMGEEVPVSYVLVEGGKHAMLSHHATFDGLAAEHAAATLLGLPGGATTARVAAGERWIEA